MYYGWYDKRAGARPWRRDLQDDFPPDEDQDIACYKVTN